MQPNCDYATGGSFIERRNFPGLFLRKLFISNFVSSKSTLPGSFIARRKEVCLYQRPQETWTAFVQVPRLNCSQKTMTNPQAIDRLRQVLRRQHKALSTEDCYLFWLRRYIFAVRSMPKELSSEKKLEQFLTGLALRDNVSASTQNQAFNAVLFFYREVLGQPLGNVNALRAKRPAHERHAPTVAETNRCCKPSATRAATPPT